MLKIGLYIMGLKGLNCLKAVHSFVQKNEQAQLSHVVYAKDKNVENDYSAEIEHFCKEHTLKLSDRNTANEDLANVSDINFAIGWRWMIDNSNDTLIVLHDSILPKYRGFNPLVTALIEGDREIGVTALKANAEFDEGNIVGVKTTEISYPVKIEKAIEKISELYNDLIIEVLEKKLSDSLQEEIQDDAKASYSLWRDEEDYHVDWNQDANRILNFINAVGFPYAGAVSYVDGKKIKIIDAEITEDLIIANRTPGKILFMKENEPVVVCAKGLLKIKTAVDAATEQKVFFQKFRSRFK